MVRSTPVIKHGGGSAVAWACMAACGTQLVFTDEVTHGDVHEFNTSGSHCTRRTLKKVLKANVIFSYIKLSNYISLNSTTVFKEKEDYNIKHAADSDYFHQNLV